MLVTVWAKLELFLFRRDCCFGPHQVPFICIEIWLSHRVPFGQLTDAAVIFRMFPLIEPSMLQLVLIPSDPRIGSSNILPVVAPLAGEQIPSAVATESSWLLPQCSVKVGLTILPHKELLTVVDTLLLCSPDATGNTDPFS